MSRTLGLRALAAVLLGCVAVACNGVAPPSGATGDSGPVLPDVTPADSLGPTHGDCGTRDGSDGSADSDSGSGDGAQCDRPVPLTDGVTVNDRTPSTGTPSTLCRPSDAPQRFFSLTIPVGRRAVITARPAASFEAVVRVLEGCDADHCLTDEQSDHDGDPVTVHVDNWTDQALHKIVTVSATSADTGGAFSIVAQLEPLPGGTTPPNTTCATALPVASGARLTGQDIAQATGHDIPCTGFATSNVLFYSVTIPPNDTLVARVAPQADPPWSPALSVSTSCTATACAASTNRGQRPGDPVTISYTNRSAAPQTVILTVGAVEPNPTGTFDLAVDVLPPAPNATCEGATTVSNGTVLLDQNLALGGFGATGCAAQNGPALYYEASVPAGFAITARVRPTGVPPGRSLVQILGACGSACLVRTSPGAMHPDGRIAATYVNDTGAAQTVHIRVENFNANFPEPASNNLPGTFDLEVAILPLAANTSCATARPVSDGDFLRNLSVQTTDPVHPSSLFFRATVPPGATISASEYPVTSVSAGVQLRTVCDDPASVVAQGNDFNVTANATFTNTTGTPLDLFAVLTIAPLVTPEADTFDLFVAIARAQYAESSIPPACDDLSGADVIVPVGGAPRVLDLPFAFPFFGTTATRYAALPEGVAQLFADDGTIVSQAAARLNEPIPWPEPPNGFVAPFWQPLFGGSIRAAQVGEWAKPHFTIEWTDWRFDSFDVNQHLTFQAKLFADTGVIEFHYCRLEVPPPPGIETGQFATVGIEAPSGTRGVQHSYRQLDAVSTSQAIRFTPVE